MKQFKVGLLGCGTVGTGVARMLLENRELITSRLGAELVLHRVADIDTTRDRGIQFEPGVLVADAQAIVCDPDIDIVIEMIGGLDIAGDLMLQAFENKKPVITANKALLAVRGRRMFEAAAAHGVDLAFEASVGGAMPVIKTLRESLAGNHLAGMSGILNGTCNYILSKITAEGLTFEAALHEARQHGYAEADSSLDVDGWDTAHKLAIVCALAYGANIDFHDIYVEGISGITPLDIEFAAQFGYRIKLLAISKYTDSGIEARVHPTMIPFDNLLSSVNGSLNAVMLSTDMSGNILLYGRGAGMLPTAAAVLSDVVDVARNLLYGSVGRVPPRSYQPAHIRQVGVKSIDEIVTQYYFRFAALDQPGVLSKISGILGNYHISIESVHQKGRKSSGAVPLVMLTHPAGSRR
jgi:homoserine dehydrogenase